MRTNEKDLIECNLESNYVSDFEYYTLDQDLCNTVDKKQNNFFDKLSKLKLNSQIKQVDENKENISYKRDSVKNSINDKSQSHKKKLKDIPK